MKGLTARVNRVAHTKRLSETDTEREAVRRRRIARNITIALVYSALLPGSLAAALNPVAMGTKKDCEHDLEVCRSEKRIFWIAPAGKDENSGRSRTSPWKSFGRAIPALRPGDTLMLEDGVYEGQSTGYPDVNCRGGAAKGTSSAPITIRAEHERQAFIRGDGTAYPFRMQNCQYWIIEGLHIENGDFKNTARGDARFGDALYLYADRLLVVRRNLLARNNRYSNSHLIDNYYSNHSLYIENEFYYFSRHGVLDMYGGFNTYRRNYFNSRGYADLADGRPSGAENRGDSAICLYPAHDSIVENNISEGQRVGYDIQCAYRENACNNNKFFGNISLHDVYGHVFKARGMGDSFMPHDTYAVNELVIDPGELGFYARATKNTVCDHCSFFGGGKAQMGVVADRGGRGETGDGNYSVVVKNSIVVNFHGLPGFGFMVEDGSGSWQWTWENLVAYGNRIDYFPPVPNAHATNTVKLDPQLGTCRAWVPSQSPLKKAKGLSDVGASIVYRYKDGQLSDSVLWDPKTREFPHGEVIPELNGVPGESVIDVQQRLNVGTNGCDLPKM